MENYQELWEERKGFLKTSCLIGVIIALVCTALMGKYAFASVSNAGDFVTAIIVMLMLFVMFALFFIAVVSVGRMVFGKSESGSNFAIGLVNGIWTATLNAFSGSLVGIVIGLCMALVFLIAFGIVAAIYAIYLPISSIYYFAKAKQVTA